MISDCAPWRVKTRYWSGQPASGSDPHPRADALSYPQASSHHPWAGPGLRARLCGARGAVRMGARSTRHHRVRVRPARVRAHRARQGAQERGERVRAHTHAYTTAITANGICNGSCHPLRQGVLQEPNHGALSLCFAASRVYGASTSTMTTRRRAHPIIHH